MVMNLSNLTIGMGPLFIRSFMDTGRRQTHICGERLFEEGEAAHHIYALIEGEVCLLAGGVEAAIYTVCHHGELFGWPFLVTGNTYTTSAVCTQPVETIRFDRDMLFDLFVNNPGKGVLFYKKLTEMLRKRLPTSTFDKTERIYRGSGVFENMHACCH